MGKIILVFCDQLSLDLCALDHADKEKDIILMIEAREDFSCVRHHQQKIVLIISAMRHLTVLKVLYARLSAGGSI